MRLTESPVVVVTSQFGYSAQQEKVMRAQSFQNKDQVNMMSGRKTLEVNPNHPVLVNLVYRLMSKELGVDPDAPLKEVEVPEGEEEEEEAEEEEKDESDDSGDEDGETKEKEEL